MHMNAAYSDANGNLLPSFYNALGIYCWAWFILTVIYTVGAMRGSWPLFLALFLLDIVLILMAVGFMVQSNSVLTAGYSIGFIVTFFSCELFLLPWQCLSL
jgi:succinate-acetate transporter protein